MWTADAIKDLRNGLGETREIFAKRFRSAVGTVRNWEQGISSPTGPAEVILDQAKSELELRLEKQPA